MNIKYKNTYTSVINTYKVYDRVNIKILVGKILFQGRYIQLSNAIENVNRTSTVFGKYLALF